MGLVYLTGIPGVGKSTVRLELSKRGYEAHDTDEDDFRCWRDVSSKRFMPEITTTWDEATHEFKELYSMDLRPEKVAALAERAAKKIIFLCGAVPNDRECWQYFDSIVCLTIDNPTMQHRITTRTNNNYGKDPSEMADLLVWNLTSADTYKDRGATIIDAHQPLDKVVDDVIRSVETHATDD